MWRRKYTNLPLPKPYHHYYDDPNQCFRRFEGKIKSILIIKNPSERRDKRAVQLVRFLTEIHSLISEWEMFRNTPDGVNFFQDEIGEKRHTRSNRSDHAKDADEQQGEKMQPENPSLAPETAEDIKKLLEEENVDISKMVALAVNDPEATVMKTCLQKGVAVSSCSPDEDQVKRLKKIFKNQEVVIRKAQRKRLRRGLTEGKLDPRRLHRAGIDGKVFRNKDAAGNKAYWQICIVVDASSSMGDKSLVYKSWNMAEKALVSIAEAFKGTRNLLSIYAYNENRNVCRLTRLDNRGQLFTVMPGGRTPSGQAILSAAMILDRRYKNSMMIHITDGASNCGLRLADAISFCRKKRIQIYTIGCGCNPQTREFLTGCFSPANVFFMHDIKYLSEGVEKLLSQKMLVQI
jgi:Mg-chelatase subunit ChlD